jgi:hypothetical protein
VIADRLNNKQVEYEKGSGITSFIKNLLGQSNSDKDE